MAVAIRDLQSGKTVAVEDMTIDQEEWMQLLIDAGAVRTGKGTLSEKQARTIFTRADLSGARSAPSGWPP